MSSTFGKLRQAMRSAKKPILALTGMYILGPSAYKTGRDWVKNEKLVLVIPFHRMQIVERRYRNLSGENQIELKTLVDTIHEAANDPNVVALYGDFGMGPQSQFSVEGYAQLEEIRNAVRVFNESHRVHLEPNVNHDPDFVKPQKSIPKQSIAYAESFEAEGCNLQYFLASQFSEIAMKDRGNLNLYGTGLQATFLKSFLEKYGIKAHVYKHGKYKNLANSLTETKYNAPHLKNSLSLIQSLDNSICRSIVDARGLGEMFNTSMWKKIRSHGTMTSEHAKEIGFVQILAKANPLNDLLTGNTNTVHPFGGVRAAKVIDIEEYSSKFNLKRFIRKMKMELKKSDMEHICLIYAVGGIDAKLADRVINDLKKAEKDDLIKCVVLRVDSKGGSAVASEAIYSQCKYLSKPVVCSMGNYAASGGYYIAAAANKIFAMPTTLTGSIGVFGIKLDLSDLASQYGIAFGHVGIGEYSNTMSPFLPMTRKMQQNISRNIDNAYHVFKEVVAEGRQKKVKDIEKVAQGRVWTGEQAKLVGLVDELGGLHKAIAYAQNNFTQDKNARVVEIQHARWTDLFNSFAGNLTNKESRLNNSAGIIDLILSKSCSNMKDGRGMVAPVSSGLMLTMSDEDALELMIEEIIF